MSWRALFMSSLVSFSTALFGSQVLVQPRFTSSFIFKATDVWDIDVQFQGVGSARVFSKVTISSKGKPIAELQSEVFLIKPGVQSYTSVTLGTLRLNFFNSSYFEIEQLTGSFPAGNYTACYNLYCVNADCDGLGPDALYNEVPMCYDFTVEPPTPILLSFPEDRAEIEWPRPTFQWIPPMPISQVSGFSYLYTLVERNKNQSCQDAVIRNRPVYKQNGIDLPVLPFPAEINDLDTGKKYCWKVDGLIGDIPVAQSEVWEFKLKSDTPEILGFSMIQVELQLTLDAYKIKLTDTLAIKYTEEYSNSSSEEVQISIWDESKHSGTKIIDNLLKVAPGKSVLVLEPWEIEGLKPGGVYIIKVQNAKGEQLFARINIQQDK